MKYDMMVRSRAIPCESIESKHERFFDRVRKMPHPWGIAGQEPPACPDIGSHELIGTDVSKFLGRGVRGQICYLYRYDGLATDDRGMNDDFVDLCFDPRRVDYRQLILESLPIYIEAFDAYVAEVFDDDFTHKDFDSWRASGIDSRHGVFRVHPVSFFDATLCKRAFGLSPKHIAERLYGRIEDVRLIHNGVYLIGSSAPLEFELADRLSCDMKRWILGK